MSQEETTLFAGFEKGVGGYGQTLDKRQVGQRSPRETSAPPTSRKCSIPINPAIPEAVIVPLPAAKIHVYPEINSQWRLAGSLERHRSPPASASPSRSSAESLSTRPRPAALTIFLRRHFRRCTAARAPAGGPRSATRLKGTGRDSDQSERGSRDTHPIGVK